MSLLSNQELREKLDGKQNRHIVKWLQDHRIRFTYDCKRRPITTLSAIDRVLFRAMFWVGENSENKVLLLTP